MSRTHTCATVLAAVGLLTLIGLTTSAQQPPTEIGIAVPIAGPAGASAGTITIRSIDDPFTEVAQATPLPAGQRYVLLRVVVEAADDKPFRADPSEVLLQDADGFLWEYTDVPRPPDALPFALQAQDLSPGDRLSAVIGFAVPTTAVVNRIVYQDASQQRIIVLLDETPRVGPGAGFGTPVPIADPAGASAGTITIRSIDDPFTAYLPADPPAADERYILLNVVFEAADDKPFRADPGGIVLKDTDGFLWEYADVSRPPEAQGDVRERPLSPGDRISGPIGYVVPNSSIIDQILYRSESGARLTTLVDSSTSDSARPSTSP